MYEIYMKEKTADGYIWKFYSLIDADIVEHKDYTIILLKNDSVVFSAPSRYTMAIKIPAQDGSNNLHRE